MISSEFKHALEAELSRIQGEAVSINSSKTISGGSINLALMLSTTSGNYFLKYNDKDAYPGMFDVEKQGLELLSTGNHIRIPKLFSTGEYLNYTYIIMEWIEPGAKTNEFWIAFGRTLANLHRETQPKYGLDHDNFMGSLKQSNQKKGSWAEFFIENRLEPQLKMALNNGFSFSHSFESIYNFLGNEYPEEQPALVHGDLWSGNFLANDDEKPVLIDPATYYGHREVDIAMSTLFGGFDSRFYESYDEENPMQPGWQERIDICNLYPLLVHVNLFGEGYVSQVNQILRKFN